MYTDRNCETEYVTSRSLFKSLVCLTTAITVSFCVIVSENIYNLGRDDEIALQVSERFFTASDLHVVENMLNSEQNISGQNRLMKSSMRVKRENEAYRSQIFTLREESPDSQIENVEINDFVEDGSEYWTAKDNVSLRMLPNTDSERLAVLEVGSSITRISYGSYWSYVLTEDEEYGFILSKYITDEEPEPTPTPSPTPSPTATSVPTEAPIEENSMDNEETGSDSVVSDTDVPNEPSEETAAEVTEETKEPQETQDNIAVTVSETDCDLNCYASCELNMRSGPDVAYDLIGVLHTNDALHVVAQTDNGWYKLDNGSYVKSALTVEEPIAIPEPTESSIQVGNDFGNFCLSFVGTGYVYGGASPAGFDCSGFASYVMANYYGISLPHSADDISKLGTAVNGDEVQPGDILCHDFDGDGYIEHVSVYIGDGLCVHASNSRSGVISANYPIGSVVTIRRFV